VSRSNSTFELIDVETEAQVAVVRALVREYAAWINVDLCFQEIDAEIDGLPGKYAAARGGVLLLALNDAEPAGCAALRALEPGICEMKRLWVREAFRGARLGELLARTILRRAAEMGYAIIRLDTLAHMTRAQRLYAQLGFRQIPAYYDNPIPGTIYLECALVDRSSEAPVKRVQTCERPSSETPMKPLTFRRS
jgi:ribosomal protein S18 acetylase RimI-like enzyme